jgi:hypothetical protein
LIASKLGLENKNIDFVYNDNFADIWLFLLVRQQLLIRVEVMFTGK